MGIVRHVSHVVLATALAAGGPLAGVARAAEGIGGQPCLGAGGPLAAPPALPPVLPPVDVECCDDPPTDEDGDVVLPAGATDVREDDVDVVTGPTAALYPAEPTTVDTWYGSAGLDCPWAVGGEVPPMDDFMDVEGQLRDAGFTSPAPDLVQAIDRMNEDLPALVTRPAPDAMVAQGRVPHWCWPGPTGLRRHPWDCPADTRTSVSTEVLGGRDVIFVHGFDPGTVAARLAGDPRAETAWPADATEFTDPAGFWKERADAYWADHITTYLRHGTSGAVPTNRYLTVAWASTQWLAVGAHAFLSQVADAMITGAGVVPDASGSTAGFCANGCVVVSHSTGGPLTDVALSIAAKSGLPPFSAIGNLTWLPPRIRSHVAYAGAFNGSHYATVAAALGWAATLSVPACELAQWVVDVVFGVSLPCSRITVVAESVLTDLAVPVMQLVWRPLIATTPVPVLLVTGAHPTLAGSSLLKAVSPIVKLLFHHGLDDGVLSMDSQCATTGDWRTAPTSYTARGTFHDRVANAYLLTNGLPAVVVARAFDMGIPFGRAVMYYVDQVLGAQLLTPQFWKAVTGGAVLAHFAGSKYRVASACVPYLSATGMVQQVAAPRHPASGPQGSLPNHHPLLMSSSDHGTAALGPYDTGCYEHTFASGRDCSAEANAEEVRTVTDASLYARGLVDPAFGTLMTEQVKGRRISFRIGFVRFRWWIWKRTYHRLDGWETKTAADYVNRYVA